MFPIGRRRFAMAHTKRLIDIVLACLALVLFAPVLLFLTVVIVRVDG
jgi:lipopolysaccharide/colanic/teichoic acid biosynthesis glycosyltransferase